MKPSGSAEKQKRSKSKKDKKKQQSIKKAEAADDSDEEKVYVPIDKDKLNFCKYRGCQQHKFGPHKHYLKQCEEHKFCEMAKGSELVDDENSLAFMSPSERVQNQSNAQVQEFAHKMVEYRAKHKLSHKGQKIAADTYSLDHWWGQAYGVDITDVPAFNRDNVLRDVYTKLLRDYGQKRKDPTAIVIDGQDQDSDDSQSYPDEQKQKKHPARDTKKPWEKPMFEFQPLIYPISKRVTTIADKHAEELAQQKEKQPRRDLAAKAQKVTIENVDDQQNADLETKEKERKSSSVSCPLEREVSRRYRSQYIKDVMQRKEVSSCVNQMKQARETRAKQAELREAQHKQEADEREACAHTKKREEKDEGVTVGKAKYINLKKAKKDQDIEIDKRDALNKSVGAPHRHKRAPLAQQLSTFQKLQQIRVRNKGSSQLRHEQLTNKNKSPKRHPAELGNNESQNQSQVQNQGGAAYIKSLMQHAATKLEQEYQQQLKVINLRLNQDPISPTDHLNFLSEESNANLHEQHRSFDQHMTFAPPQPSSGQRTSQQHSPNAGQEKQKNAAENNSTLRFVQSNNTQLQNYLHNYNEQDLQRYVVAADSQKDLRKRNLSGGAGGEHTSTALETTNLGDLLLDGESSKYYQNKLLSRNQQATTHSMHQSDAFTSNMALGAITAKHFLVRTPFAQTGSNKRSSVQQNAWMHELECRRGQGQSINASHQRRKTFTSFQFPISKQRVQSHHAGRNSGQAALNSTQAHGQPFKQQMLELVDARHLQKLSPKMNRDLSSTNSLGIKNVAQVTSQQIHRSSNQGIPPSKSAYGINLAKKTNQISYVNIEDQGIKSQQRAGQTPSNPIASQDPDQMLKMHSQVISKQAMPNFAQKQSSQTSNVKIMGNPAQNRTNKSLNPYSYASKGQLLGKSGFNAQKSQIQQMQNVLVSGPVITDADIERELIEPKYSELNSANQQISVILDLMQPDMSKFKKNVFECAEYWLYSGYKAQTGLIQIQALQQGKKKANANKNAKEDGKQDDKNDQALDSYLQGLRKDKLHYGCCFNIGITYMRKGKSLNAQKWFRYAKQINPTCREPYLGEAISSFKLGAIRQAIYILRQRPRQNPISDKKRRTLLKGNTFEDVGEFSDTLSQTLTCSHSKELSGEKKEEGDNEDNVSDKVSQRTDNEDQAEVTLLGQVPLDIEFQFTFLQSICYKQSQHFEKSQAQYKKLEKIFKSRQGYKLAKCVFTNLMLPMQVNRKIVENYVQLFLESVQITNKDAYWDADLYDELTNLLHYKTKEWEDDKKGIEFIRKMPLFKRLKNNGYTYQQWQALLPNLIYRRYFAGDVIFKEKDNVYIVLNGRVVLRYHEEDPLEYQYIAQYTAGSVIYHSGLDSGYSQMGQVYPTVVSSKCILLQIKQEIFDEMIWKRTKKQKTEIKIKQLQQYPFCKELCQQTLYNIMYECGKIKLFRPGQLVLRLHIRSPLNSKGRDLYDQEYGSHMKAQATQETNDNQFTSQHDAICKASAFGNFFRNAATKKHERERHHLDDDDFVQIGKPKREARPGNPPESNIGSLVLILEGSCKVMVPEKNFEVFELRSGNHFGASDLLRIPDIEYLGQIIAGEKGCKCMVISAPDQVVQLWERKNLQAKLKNSIDTLKHMVEHKYELRFDSKQIGTFQSY